MKFVINHFVIAILILILLGVTAYTADFMYWDSNFDPIVMANITTRDGESEGESELWLFTTGNAEISADNTDTAKLTGPGGDSLVTEYKLRFDGDGSSNTGGSTVSFTSYDSFLSTPVSITYVPDDNDVNVKLSVKAKNYANEVANAGEYTAIQTLTVSWVGP
ncbi:MAG: hypothetical protein ACYS18_08690 [Planctomycetota bacterium]